MLISDPGEHATAANSIRIPNPLFRNPNSRGLLSECEMRIADIGFGERAAILSALGF
jgi:hypothetical protein